MRQPPPERVAVASSPLMSPMVSRPQRSGAVPEVSLTGLSPRRYAMPSARSYERYDCCVPALQLLGGPGWFMWR